jgi:alkaline phosphatase D
MRRRDALAAAAAPWFVRHARAADAPRFELGVASGQPRADGVVLWTRLVGAGLAPQVEVRWELAHDEAFTRIAARGSETALAADAHCVHAEPAGLEPGRPYWYRFEALGQRSAVGRTRTAPAPDAAVARLDFAIASCQRFDHGHYAAWRHAASEGLDLVVFLGDYIYEYASNPTSVRGHEGGSVRTLDEYRARYAQYKRDPALQAAHAACPWLVIWDDHEVENDYAGLHSQSGRADFPAQRAAAYRAWWEHMPVAKALRPVDGSTRIFGRLDWGRLARFHLVDDRQWRDLQACPRPLIGGTNTVRLANCPELADPKRSLLGAAQEAWLADGWDLERPWNLLAQQTLMARFGSDTAWTDGWDGYAPARGRLLGAVARKKVPGVVVLGGDVHTNYVADLKLDWDDPKAPVVASEFCGTSITSTTNMAQWRLDGIVAQQPHIKLGRADRRGYVRFTVEPRALLATLRTVDDPLDAASGMSTLARFAVDPARPGPQPA